MTVTVYETSFQIYEEQRPRMAEWVQRHYIDEFKLKPGPEGSKRPMLDVACGNGFWGGVFAEKGFDVYGFDMNVEYLEDGRHKWPELALVEGDVEERFPWSQRFPLVFVRTLPHFYQEDLEASLPVMERILDATASNGSVLLTFWTDESSAPTDSGFWLWPESDFRRLIERAGGRVGKVVRASKYLMILAYPSDRPGVEFQKTNGLPGTYPQSFGLNGLAQLDDFLSSAKAVTPMRESPHARDLVAMRHDVDHSLDHALKFARWEAERGYRSTYFLLHTAPYWRAKDALYAGIAELQALGHEVGLHVNAVIQARAEGKSTPQDGGANPAGNCARAAEIITEVLAEMRNAGADVVGTAAHGDARCSEWNLSNLDIWAAGYKPEDFGLEYEAYHRHQSANYLSDNGGRWVGENNEILTRPHFHKSLATHLLVHPIHWPVNE